MTRTIRRAARRGCAAAFVAASLAIPAAAFAQVDINLDSGPIQGQVNENTREFLGIPYAAPPVGNFRFRPPQPVTSWVSTLETKTYPPGCSQLPVLTNGDNRIENEDCLFLNVWTPNPAPAEPAPVMVWFHGGSNVSGSTADFVPFPDYEGVRLYDGHFLSQNRNVVVVTVNYRLNVFGFLGLDELAGEDVNWPHAGNQGLLDQRKALQWVQANIAAFGGNPANVTIFGESAGSWDVCAHVASPGSTGLFQKAISESGGCSVGVQTAEASSNTADIIAEAVGCDTAMDRLACMRAVPIADLLDASPLVDLAGETTNLGVSIDGGFLVEHPRDTFTTRRKPKIPYILGANSDEGTLFFIGSPELTDQEYSDALVTQFGAYAPEIEALYPVDNFATPRDALIRVVGDAQLVCGTYDTAARYASKGQKTYVYNFNRKPPLPFIGALGLGVFHGLEIGYVFGSVGAPTQIDQEVSDHVQEYWASFADRGKPLIPKSTKWPRFKAKTWKLIRLDSPLALPTDFRRPQCEFWTKYYNEVLP